MNKAAIGIVEKPLTDAEAETAFVAFVEVFDALGCCPAATVATKVDEGVSFSAHFSSDRARKLIGARNARTPDPIIMEMVEALEEARIVLRENGFGEHAAVIVQIDTLITKVSGK